MASTRTNKITIPKTGQTTSYSDYDDGYYEKGSPISPRFVDNGDGTISDRVTSLMWVKNTVLIIPGVSVRADNQLQSAKGNWATSTTYVKGDLVKDTSDNTYWACVVDHTSIASAAPYSVAGDGELGGSPNGNYSYDGEFNGKPSYKMDASFWVIFWQIDGIWYIADQKLDNVTAYWLKGPSATPVGYYNPSGSATGNPTVSAGGFSGDRAANPTYWRQTVWTNSANDLVSRPDSTWQEAIDRCEALEYAGYSDWRLPNTRELLSLDDYSKNNPSVDDTYFTDLVADDTNEYWSSTTDSANTPNSLNAEYYGGGIISDSKGGEFLTVYTRPVRGGRN